MMKLVKTLSLTLLAVICLASCSNNDYKNFVPKNADLVVEVQPAQIVQSMKGFFDKNKNLLSSQMGDMTDYFDGTKPIGLDFESPAYIFHAPYGGGQVVGFTMKMDNKDNFKDFFTELNQLHLCDKPYEADGLNWVELDGDSYAVFDDNIFVLAIEDGFNKSESKEMINKLLDQKEEKSFVSTEEFKKMTEQPGSVKLYCNLKDLTAQIDDHYLTRAVAEINSYLPSGANVMDFKFYANVIFKEGLLEANVEVDTDNKNNKELLDVVNNGFKKLEANAIGTDDQFLLWAGVGLDGNNLITGLDDYSNVFKTHITKYLDSVVNGRETIKSINGDCSFVMTWNDNHPLYQGLAKINNDQFLEDDDNIIELLEDEGGIRMNEVPGSGHMYEISEMDDTWHLGTKDGYFCFGNTENGTNVMTNYQNNKLMAVKNEINNSIAYLYINNDAIKDICIKKGEWWINRIVDYMDYYTISCKDIRNVKVRIIMKDKETPFLTQFFTVLSDLASSVGQIYNKKEQYYDDY